MAAVQIPVEHWDVLFIHVILSKLPDRSTLAWKQLTTNEPFPPINELLDFLENRARALDQTRSQSTVPLPATSLPSNSGNRTNLSRSSSKQVNSGAPTLTKSDLDTTSGKCPHCGAQHPLYGCGQFVALSVEQRFNRIKGSNLCFNCLKPGHSTRACPSRSCRRCPGKKHNTLLCRNEPNSTNALAGTTAGTISSGATNGETRADPVASGSNQPPRVLRE